ncbi:endonuclease III domain-containing protein [Desmospora profundinema]|uniref:Endonuclease-3 related protein n=1 Tax=Desmospora profundinema TaxID=1571184 RepID=A0ABU1IJJ5_9BACL|nr:endonuclease [Desmospora profundinema]MDR6224856.1 endonuclease-3 related protein [Desmospora profundinema]
MESNSLTPDSVRICWELLRRWHPELTTDAWWGVESPFERAVGGVLVQRTTWRQALQALVALREIGWTKPAVLADQEEDALHQRIRPAGFFRAKAATLIRLARWWSQQGGESGLASISDERLRAELLSIHGIGPETADLILSDAFGRATFVTDAYSRRIWSRWLGIPEPDEEAVRQTVRDTLRWPQDLSRLHAWMVELGKAHCRKGRPLCSGCPLWQSCVYYRGEVREG